ncbi:MAG TPA: PEGA domain-containing protein [Candidatus Paceibacterota bacterium]|nr:PEGA domain-containing protein [Candidatus Paceibacterota bacterium]
MNKMYLKMTAIIMASVFLFSSCASIVSKSTYPLSINSSPSNAKVSITDKKGKEIYLGNTPATVKLKAGAGFFSKAEYQVKFSSPGYDDKIVPITFKLDGWYFGNLLLGGVLGMLIIDPATGAMWKIETEFLNETLSKSTASIDPEMKIMNINEIPENWKTHLVRVN